MVKTYEEALDAQKKYQICLDKATSEKDKILEELASYASTEKVSGPESVRAQNAEMTNDVEALKNAKHDLDSAEFQIMKRELIEENLKKGERVEALEWELGQLKAKLYSQIEQKDTIIEEWRDFQHRFNSPK